MLQETLFSNNVISVYRPGDRITAAYRDYKWQGTVLAINDTRAWANTLAMGFSNSSPTQEAVDAHVNNCIARGLDMYNRIPVLWDFGKVYFEDVKNLELV